VKKLVLIGCGEAHAEVLRQMAAKPAANADITLVAPSSNVLQSARVPGLVAGHFDEADCRTELTPLMRAAGVRHVADRIAGLDTETRIAVTAGGDEFEFDFVSVDVGATSLNPDVPGLGKFALLAQPVDVFLQGWERVRELAQEGALSRLTVVGGGVEAVELLLAMHFNLRRSLSPEAFAACGFSIVTEGERLIETLPESLGRAAEAACLARGISLLRGAAVVEVERDAVRLANGARLTSDITVWAAGARGARWQGVAGLACDTHGLPRVDEYLRSTSHKRVLVAGRGASAEERNVPSSGSRDGPLLAASLRQVLAGEPPVALPQPRAHIDFVTLGSMHALAARGAVPLKAPAWMLWRYKEWLDRRARRRFARAG